MTRPFRPLLAALPAMLAASAAAAHPGHELGGAASGFLHPMLGLDHVAAMVGVGLWAAMLGRPAAWVLPVVFPLVMVLGGVLGMAGVALPAVEAGIALSGVALGLLVAAAVRAPLWVSGLVVAAFAVFHGHAHGTELPAAADPATYAMGFVTGTALLHLAGIGLGALLRRPLGGFAARGAGLAVAAVGTAFLTGIA